MKGTLMDAREQSRRDFWRERMEAGYRFMMEIMRCPVVECGQPLVSLRASLRGTGLEVSFSRRRRMQAGPALFLARK